MSSSEDEDAMSEGLEDLIMNSRSLSQLSLFGQYSALKFDPALVSRLCQYPPLASLTHLGLKNAEMELTSARERNQLARVFPNVQVLDVRVSVPVDALSSVKELK
eukprot:TRINITY_DN766_c0_g3_i1.p3 TRINITY_DN766_c0_g3~~TRINITY_DN766_c0_g3_i1.p3  ORF type:complete len:105 (-),score=13.58 TRINITY_DN766_c0_g3_i1:1913-2227(-)